MVLSCAKYVSTVLFDFCCLSSFLVTFSFYRSRGGEDIFKICLCSFCAIFFHRSIVQCAVVYHLSKPYSFSVL